MRLGLRPGQTPTSPDQGSPGAGAPALRPRGVRGTGEGARYLPLALRASAPQGPLPATGGEGHEGRRWGRAPLAPAAPGLGCPPARLRSRSLPVAQPAAPAARTALAPAPAWPAPALGPQRPAAAGAGTAGAGARGSPLLRGGPLAAAAPTWGPGSHPRPLEPAFRRVGGKGAANPSKGFRRSIGGRGGLWGEAIPQPVANWLFFQYIHSSLGGGG